MGAQDGFERNSLLKFDYLICRGIEKQIREAPQFEVDRRRPKERPRKTWINRIKGDMETPTLSVEDAQDRGGRET